MTIVTWYNKTLEIDRCDEDKILQLRQVCFFILCVVLVHKQYFISSFPLTF